MILVLAQVPQEISEAVSLEILKRKLALSINIINVKTLDQDLNRSNNCILIIKTRKELFSRIVQIIKSFDSSINEILSIKIIDADIEFYQLLESATSLKRIKEAENA